MNGKEAPRPGILKALCDERITNREAATALRLTVRQVQRLTAPRPGPPGTSVDEAGDD